MKYIKLFIAIALLAIFNVSCDNDLPYPLDDVKRGVVIDVSRVAGTEGVLAPGVTDGNYKVKLQIPSQQGDYSNLDYAQLVCVYTGVDGKKTSVVAVDKITEFPTDVTIDIADVYRKLGKTSPELGELLQFTTNVVLKDGYVVYGWNQYSGFNNVAMVGWQVDGRDYSSNVRYSVACRLVLEEFERQVTVVDGFWEETYQAKMVKKSDTELELQGVFGESDTNPIIITVNPVDYSVTVSKQVIYPDFYGYTNLAVVGVGTIDACQGSISFVGTFSVDQGGYGPFNITIY